MTSPCADAHDKQVTRENDALILERLMGILHELPRREREAVLAGASFRTECDALRAAIEHVVSDSPGTPDSVKAYLRKALADA